MRDMYEFRDLEILPMLGDFADEFDVEAICDEVTDVDPIKGVVWKQKYCDRLSGVEALNEVLARHDLANRGAEN